MTSGRWAMLAVVVAGLMTAASPAQAQCPRNDGTLPGSSPSVTTLATPAATFYVDDRDMLDLDGDDDAGGIWIYLESNDQEGLQRGGEPVVFAVVHDQIDPWLPPHIGPIPVYVDVPGYGRVGFTLFPNGFGGCSCTPPPEPYDDCVESANPDTLLF